MRRPLAWYSRGYPEAGAFRRRVNAIVEVRELEDEIERFFGPAEEAETDRAG